MQITNKSIQYSLFELILKIALVAFYDLKNIPSFYKHVLFTAYQKINKVTIHIFSEKKIPKTSEESALMKLTDTIQKISK